VEDVSLDTKVDATLGKSQITLEANSRPMQAGLDNAP